MNNQVFSMNGEMRKVWVVFSGQTDLWWLRALKPGFRHCFVLMHDGQCWVSYDPMSHYTDITVHHMPGFFDMPGWLEGRGMTVAPATIDKTHGRPAPFGIFSCVEAVKRVIGLHSGFVVTPWQLYRALQRRNAVPVDATQSGFQEQEKEYSHGQSYLPA